MLIYFIDISTTNFYLLHAFRFIDQDTLTYSSSSTPLKLKSQPKAVAHEDDLTAVVTLDSVHLIKNGSIVQEEKVDYEPSCVSISKDQQSLAVGDAGQGMRQIKIVRYVKRVLIDKFNTVTHCYNIINR